MAFYLRLDTPQLPRQANITANDLSRDYRRISQPLASLYC